MGSGKAKAEVVKVVPSFYVVGDDGKPSGVLRKLTRKNFPKTKEGRMAWCDYMVIVWNNKKSVLSRSEDPADKLREKIKKLQDKLASLTASAKK